MSKSAQVSLGTHVFGLQKEISISGSSEAGERLAVSAVSQQPPGAAEYAECERPHVLRTAFLAGLRA